MFCKECKVGLTSKTQPMKFAPQKHLAQQLRWHLKPSESLGQSLNYAFNSSFLQKYKLKAASSGQSIWFLPPMRDDLKWVTAPALAWPSPGYCKHMRYKPTNLTSLTHSPLLLLNKFVFRKQKTLLLFPQM